jgi:hypothetical protein
MGRPRIQDEFSSVENRSTRWKLRNPERNKLIWRRWYLKHRRQDILRVTKFQNDHPDLCRKWKKNAYKSRGINARIAHRLRGRLHAALRCRGVKKIYKTLDLLGCSCDYLRKHLEKQFKPGMTWENFGKWEIDHRLPCVSFDLTKKKQQKYCFHYSNLQPLFVDEHRRKTAKERKTWPYKTRT